MLPLVTLTNQGTPTPWKYAISTSKRDQYANKESSPKAYSSNSNSSSNSTFKYLLDSEGRPLLIEKTTQSTSAYTDSRSDANRDNSPSQFTSTHYYSFYYGPNSVVLAKFNKHNPGEDKISLQDIESFKFDATSKDVSMESIYFNESSETNHQLAPAGGSIDLLKAAGTSSTKLIGNDFPDNYQFNNSNYTISTKSNRLEITSKLSTKNSVQFLIDDPGRGERITASASLSLSNGTLRIAGTATGDPKYPLKGNPKYPNRDDGSYLLGTNFSFDLKPYTGSFDTYLKWMINDAAISGYGLSSNGAGLLLSGIIGVNPLALRPVASTDTSSRSNGDLNNGTNRFNVDALTGLYTNSTQNYSGKNAEWRNPVDGLVYAGTFSSSGDTATAYSDQANLSSANLLSSGIAEALRLELGDLVKRADSIGERFELSSWGGSNRFLYTTLL